MKKAKPLNFVFHYSLNLKKLFPMDRKPVAILQKAYLLKALSYKALS